MKSFHYSTLNQLNLGWSQTTLKRIPWLKVMIFLTIFLIFKLTSYWNVIQRLRSEFKSSCCHTTIDMAIFGQQCTITGMWLPDIVFHEQGHICWPELLSYALLDIEILFLRILVIDKYLSMMTGCFQFRQFDKNNSTAALLCMQSPVVKNWSIRF